MQLRRSLTTRLDYERGDPVAPDNSLRRSAPSLVSDLNRSAKKHMTAGTLRTLAITSASLSIVSMMILLPFLDTVHVSRRHSLEQPPREMTPENYQIAREEAAKAIDDAHSAQKTGVVVGGVLGCIVGLTLFFWSRDKATLEE